MQNHSQQAHIYYDFHVHEYYSHRFSISFSPFALGMILVFSLRSNHRYSTANTAKTICNILVYQTILLNFYAISSKINDFGCYCFPAAVSFQNKTHDFIVHSLEIFDLHTLCMFEIAKYLKANKLMCICYHLAMLLVKIVENKLNIFMSSIKTLLNLPTKRIAVEWW